MNGGKVELAESICNYIRENSSADLTLPALERAFGVSRFAIQKTFKEVMGISPRKYAEECRILHLKRNLKEGDPMPKAVYNTGYNSQSWLYDDAGTKLGMSPSEYRSGGEGTTIRYLTSISRLGWLIVAETDLGVCSLNLGESEADLVKFLHMEYPKADICRAEDLKGRIDAILSYFDGQMLNIPVDLRGTDFQKRVWSAIRTIPYGETRTYEEIAEEIGVPRAYRAVANACAANPVPLIVPCHRVVRKDGGLGGYALGIERKKYLLEMERKNRERR